MDFTVCELKCIVNLEKIIAHVFKSITKYWTSTQILKKEEILQKLFNFNEDGFPRDPQLPY